MEELISVVIATYKREKELERSIKCVLNQTYKNIEIIVVDDNGLNSLWQLQVQKLMEKYKNHNNIKYIINESNMGGSLTRNVAIENAKGAYIAFLDDDDEYYPTKLEKQINLFKESNNPKLALVYCYTDSYDENNKKLYEYRYDYRGNCLVDAMYDCIAATSQWLCRKECLLEVENFTDVPCKQDSTVIIKLLNKGYEVDRVPEVLLRYNEHSNIRISAGGIKNIKGEKLLRDFCRSLYYKLESYQILQVEVSFSFRLSKLYIKNKLSNELYVEMKTLKLVNKKMWLKILVYYYLKKHMKFLNKK
ncbi:glycosyltransferase family 2 protein [Clostridium sp. CM027]|uniref:glycosyltransferase family 2 protein n=1 Tax=Clostridium sp. CM027 TaxID=2849865 RepID=UPI001C6E02CA|nr:glycosyltransferase family 2 protein [Clostridium sp. CM027]MBW9145259.1 glycosyltransferase family 2 protein [Clostridium sp. CM027]UVE40391.1 glycosyltransferase family 2 protein [Clostridium sp. CM027]